VYSGAGAERNTYASLLLALLVLLLSGLFKIVIFQRDCTTNGEVADALILASTLLRDVFFGTGIFIVILVVKIYEEVEVVPNIVVNLAVMFETKGLSLEYITANGANEAPRLNILFYSSLLISQLAESIKNDTEHHVEQDNYDDNEESKIVEESTSKCSVIPGDIGESRANTSTRQETVVKCIDSTLVDGIAFNLVSCEVITQ